MARTETLEMALIRSIRMLLAALPFCAALAPAPASAVYVSPDGLGQALIYAYYTTRPVDGNAYNTYISIVNHTLEAKALRVRFREGRNGREVASFNLFLGPRDTWVGALAAPGDSTGPTRLLVPDHSCAVPGFSDFSVSPLPFLDFSSAAYSGGFDDGLGSGNDRTREGYVEVIEMATLNGAAATGVTIGANGLPNDCTVLNAPFGPGAPTGGLSGTLTLINVQSGLDFTANADALAQLSTQAFYRGAADPYPDFNSVEVAPTSFFIAGDKGYRMTWTGAADAVSAALMRQMVENEVVLDTSTLSSTDWVVTFPTKRLYNTAPGSAGPFAPSLNADRRSIPFQLDFQARDGVGQFYSTMCVGVCPPNTVTIPLQFDWAATVIGFRSGQSGPSGLAGTSGALGSTNAWVVTLPNGIQNGSARIFFDGQHTTPRMGPASSRTLSIVSGDFVTEQVRAEGLPAVGFAVRTFRNGTLTCSGGNCQGNYGGMFMHEARRSVVP